VRAIVDFPVPAKPFSQKMHRLSCPSAQLYISCSRSTRVLGRQVCSYCLANELNGASRAVRRLSSPRLLVSFYSDCYMDSSAVVREDKRSYPSCTHYYKLCRSLPSELLYLLAYYNLPTSLDLEYALIVSRSTHLSLIWYRFATSLALQPAV